MTTPEQDRNPHGWGPPPSAPGSAPDGQDDAAPKPRYGQRLPPGAPTPRYGVPAPGPAWGPPEAPPGQQYGGQQYSGQQYSGFVPPLTARPGVIPLRPLSLGEIFDGAFNAVRRHAAVMLGLSLVVVTACVTVFTALASFLTPWLDDQMATLESSAQEPDTSLDFFTTSGVLTSALGAQVGTFFAGAIVTGLLVVAMSEVVLGTRPTGAEVWTRTGHRVGALVGVSIVTGLFVLGILAVPTAVIVLGAVTSSATVVVIGVLLALLAIPAIVWVAVSLTFAPAVLMLERCSITHALGRSWRLVRSAFWRVLGITLLAGIIVYIVQQIVSVPFGLVLGILTATTTNTLLVVVINAIGSVIGFTVGIAFSASVTSLLYIDVRMRREGLDVQLAAAATARSR